MSAQPAVSTHDVRVLFGGLAAVDGVSCEIPEGGIHSVIGPNGAGKTSLFNAITGVHSPTSGTVAVAGMDAREPCTPGVVLRCALIGLFSGSLFVFLTHIEAVWERAIQALYVYQQSFPWVQAASEGIRYFTSLPYLTWFIPWIIVSGIGMLGAWLTWARSRQDAATMSERGLSRTFQNIRLLPESTVRENILLGSCRALTKDGTGIGQWLRSMFLARSLKDKLAHAQKHVDELINIVGLTSVRDRIADELSYGAKRRVEIARALATSPKVLFLDEPAAGMNPAETTVLMDIIRTIHARGITVVLIEHHMKVVMGVSDTVMVMHQGKQIARGTPAEIRADPAVIEAYLGSGRGTA